MCLTVSQKQVIICKSLYIYFFGEGGTSLFSFKIFQLKAKIGRGSHFHPEHWLSHCFGGACAKRLYLYAAPIMANYLQMTTRFFHEQDLQLVLRVPRDALFGI